MAFGQVEAQEPALEWQQSSWSKDKPAGYELSFESWGNGIPGTVENTANYTATAHPAEPGLSREESGGDWLYKQVELHDANGYPIGYMAVGYTQFVNWVQDDQCQVPPTVVLGRPDPLVKIERPERRRSEIYCLLARYDLNGNQLWFKAFSPGIFFDIIQDSQNNIVVAGYATNLRSRAGEPYHTIRFNPPSSGPDPIPDLSTHQCEAGRERFMTVVKFDLEGNILWDHLYSPIDDLSALTKRVEGHGLIETNINGEMGYKAVGFGTTPTDGAKQVFVADLNSAGLVKTKTLYATLPGSGSGVSDTFNSQAMRISKIVVPDGEYYAITGFRLVSGGGGSSAFLWVLHNNQHQYLKDTRTAADFPGITQSRHQTSNGVCFQMQGTTPYVVWPVLANFTTNGSDNGQIDAGNHQAEALVYKYDMDGNVASAWPQPADLGIARGFDLQFNVISTHDGHLAFATTKSSGSIVTPGSIFGWGDLSQAVIDPAYKC